MGRENESLFAASGSHDQDGCHTFKNLPWNQRANGPLALGLGVQQWGHGPT